MSFEIVFSESAEKDFDEITKWYKEIRRGLDLDFILCLENELEIIKRDLRLFKEIKKISGKQPLIDSHTNCIIQLKENK